MSEMMERVVRAIYESRTAPLTDKDWNAIRGQFLGKFEYRAARAAIAAMREPTEDMVLSGAKAAADQHYYKRDVWDRPGNMDREAKDNFLGGARYGWQAMIDAVLKESP